MPPGRARRATGTRPATVEGCPVCVSGNGRAGATPEAPFGQRLRALKEGAGLTQEELAAKAGLTAKAVSALERGERCTGRCAPATPRGGS